MRALLAADVIICTPEKWDGISRNWQNRSYVKKVALLVIDEIHLLGADRCSLSHTDDPMQCASGSYTSPLVSDSL